MFRLARRTRVKFCGITRPEDAVSAVALGADLIGINFYQRSPRCVDLVTARTIASVVPPGVEIVGVFVDEDSPRIRHIAWEVGLTAVQFHGDELAYQIFRIAPLRVIKAFHARGNETGKTVMDFFRACEGNIDDVTKRAVKPSAVLIDAPKRPTPDAPQGGMGTTWNWSQVDCSEIPAPVFLAGGLNPSNVTEAVRQVHPFAVDVASGIESAPGIKDEELMMQFIHAVRLADRDA